MFGLDFTAVMTDVYVRQLVSGVLTTLTLFGAGWVCSLTLAILLAMLGSSGFLPGRAFLATYVAYHRNVPLLVQLLFWYFGLPQLLPVALTAKINTMNAEFVYALIALTLNFAAYMSENLRSGLRAVSATQFEAGRAMGFSGFQTLRWVVIPQAWRHALPALIGDTLSLFKGTAIAAVIGVADITYVVRQIESETFRVFEVFLVASVFYFAISIPLMLLGAATAARVRDGRL